MVDVVITGLAFLSSLGLAQVLLWVLAFAVIYGILISAGIFKGKAANTLISIVLALFVLMAAPLALISVIANMSTGLIALGIAILVLISFMEIAKVKDPVKGHWHGHNTWVALALVVIAGLIFVGSGGLALIGIGMLPTIGTGTWLLIIIGAAVLWMLSEKAV
jgi:O-antigen/teichoic acid export membrane protein